MSEANKELVRRFVKGAQEGGDMALVDECVAADFVDHSAIGGLPPNRDGVKLFFTAFRTAFPDVKITIHDQIAEGDKVVTRKTLAGTHRGDFMGIPPTGRPISLQVIDVLRVVGGKITDHWTVVDQMGLLQQLGVIPAQG